VTNTTARGVNFQPSPEGQDSAVVDRGERRLYWVAIRDDLIAAQEAFSEVRTRLGKAEGDLVKRASRLPAIRFLDILAWRLETMAVR
jgi:hypothetical protein